ncbi:uncharacterized protein LOC129737955 [Uranotaenia lowii]|uniref:uncharacterized protein LOC129737955 n=1 Tax=Uranotaenia lowii TaxID=190385 RepID=UPI00247B1C27|nr:uncharacterized protein LOC129737955 [Uranotaenia lowii]
MKHLFSAEVSLAIENNHSSSSGSTIAARDTSKPNGISGLNKEIYSEKSGSKHSRHAVGSGRVETAQRNSVAETVQTASKRKSLTKYQANEKTPPYILTNIAAGLAPNEMNTEPESASHQQQQQNNFATRSQLFFSCVEVAQAAITMEQCGYDVPKRVCPQ